MDPGHKARDDSFGARLSFNLGKDSCVMPAQAGIHATFEPRACVGPRLRGGDVTLLGMRPVAMGTRRRKTVDFRPLFSVT